MSVEGLGKSRGNPNAGQESAEGIVVRGVGGASEALRKLKGGGTDRRHRERRTKARTDGEASRTRNS